MKRKKRLLYRSRISDKKLRDFLRAFALDLTAVQIAKATGPNRNTVNRLCRIVRERMTEECERTSLFHGTVERWTSHTSAPEECGENEDEAQGEKRLSLVY